MDFPFPGIGVVFDIEELGGGFYGFRAWELFMQNLDPTRLPTTILVDGDTAATLYGNSNEYCIGIYGMMFDPEYVREIFETLDDPGLAPVHRRFIEKPALDQQPLVIRGNIDALGRLVTKHWDRTDHELCREAGWSYYPEIIPPELDSSLLDELKQLKQPRLP